MPSQSSKYLKYLTSGFPPQRRSLVGSFDTARAAAPKELAPYRSMVFSLVVSVMLLLNK
jgi:hypothetical protein